MKKFSLIFFFSILMFASSNSFSNAQMPDIQAIMQEAERQARAQGEEQAQQIRSQMAGAESKVKAMMAKIEQECRTDPNNCSCEEIPCQDILSAENSQAQQAYNMCMKAKGECEQKRIDAITQMKEQKSSIEEDCRKDLSKCDCSSIEDEDGKKQCELAIIEAKYQAEKEKTDKIKSCVENIDSCNCSDINDESGFSECENKLQEGKQLKEKIEKACRENPMNCNCDEIENMEAKNQCEDGVKKGMEEAEGQVKSALSKCFKNVETCNCSELGLGEQSYIDFCDIQKTYGLNCKHEGINCDKLENVDIYPVGMPSWLGKFFSKSYGDYVNKEKEKGAKEAAGIITQCLNDPQNCDCSKTPSYAKAFCEKKKALQIRCEDGDYDACIVLDAEPVLPEGMPDFTIGPMEKMVNSLKNAKKQLIMANAARKVGNMILECMDDASKCDCSLAPSGAIKTFCLHKKDLVGQCREQKIYEACFKLDEESNYPPETPDFIKGFIDSNVIPKINDKKQKIFDQMKLGTVCENIATLVECKPVYHNSGE